MKTSRALEDMAAEHLLSKIANIFEMVDAEVRMQMAG
jgi:hypothetical protein